MAPIKILLNAVGVVAVVLGVIGIFVPLLPTTPFLLLASACFLRGSKRLHHWLLTNRVFGKYIRDYEEKRAVPRRAKVAALTVMWASLGYSVYLVQLLWLQLLLVAIGVGVTIHLLRLKTLAPDE
jgi:uncharacterized protein